MPTNVNKKKDFVEKCEKEKQNFHGMMAIMDKTKEHDDEEDSAIRGGLISVKRWPMSIQKVCD